MIPLETIERLLRLPVLVVVDEAYIEFGGATAASLLNAHENLVVLRTFSKWAGMAGLRLGYALCRPSVTNYLERMRPPYNINSAAVVAGLASLDGLSLVQARLAKLIEERERLQAALTELDWLEPLPSQANFILCKVLANDGRWLAQTLAQDGILVRRFSEPRLRPCVRITVGLPDQNDRLLQALRGMDTRGNAR